MRELFNNYRKSGSKIKLPLTIEQPTKLINEENYFIDINQSDQFLIEKAEATNLRIFGKLTPIINNKSYDIDANGKYIAKQIDKLKLDLTDDNWQIVIGVATGDKGLTNIKTENINYDFKKGLPAVAAYELNTDKPNRLCFRTIFDNTLTQDDNIYVNNVDNTTIAAGVYVVDEVVDQYVFLRSEIPSISKVTDYKLTNDSILIKNVGFSNDQLAQLSTDRPNGNILFTPNIYYRKITNNELLEYYVKEVKIISVIDSLNDCGFSKSIYDTDIKTFTNMDTISINELSDNLGYPISDLYFGVIKKGGISGDTIQNVVTNFNKLIEYTDVDYLSIVNESDNLSEVPSSLSVGRKLLYGVCEYSNEQQLEREVELIDHCFLSNTTLLHYKPFTKITLKTKGDLLTSTSINGVPDYALLSKATNSYIWRKMNDWFYVDQDNGVVYDYPFLNGHIYVFIDHILNLKVEKKSTKTFTKSDNDLNDNSNQTIYGFNYRDIINRMFSSVNFNNDDNDIYNKYKDVKC